MRPVLRPATLDDSAFVFRVKKAALGEYIRQTWGWDEGFQREFHMKEYDPTTIEIISFQGAEVGWLEVDREDDAMRLTGVYVLPEHQSRGVGSAVIENIITEAVERQQDLTLEVLKVNLRAQALYEKLGFALIGETETHNLMMFDPHSTRTRSS